MNILVDFVLNKKMTEKEKKAITREKHPGCVPQDHKLAALIKKENKIYCITKNNLQNSQQYSLQNILQYSQMILNLWRWYTYYPCHRRLHIFCM